MTAEQLAILEAQRAYFASDQRIRDLRSASEGDTPVEQIDAVATACRDAMQIFDAIDPILQVRIMTRERFPPDTIALLAALRESSR